MAKATTSQNRTLQGYQWTEACRNNFCEEVLPLSAHEVGNNGEQWKYLICYAANSVKLRCKKWEKGTGNQCSSAWVNPGLLLWINLELLPSVTLWSVKSWTPELIWIQVFQQWNWGVMWWMFLPIHFLSIFLFLWQLISTHDHTLVLRLLVTLFSESIKTACSIPSTLNYSILN